VKSELLITTDSFGDNHIRGKIGDGASELRVRYQVHTGVPTGDHVKSSAVQSGGLVCPNSGLRRGLRRLRR
jgi:hypothetical protein